MCILHAGHSASLTTTNATAAAAAAVAAPAAAAAPTSAAAAADALEYAPRAPQSLWRTIFIHNHRRECKATGARCYVLRIHSPIRRPMNIE